MIPRPEWSLPNLEAGLAGPRDHQCSCGATRSPTYVVPDQPEGHDPAATELELALFAYNFLILNVGCK